MSNIRNSQIVLYASEKRKKEKAESDTPEIEQINEVAIKRHDCYSNNIVNETTKAETTK
jgi:hypothetical protein